MKGKKFDAAEKHFEKKRLELERKVKTYKEWAQEKKVENDELHDKLHILEAENEQLKKENERLLQLTELSKEDIKLMCEKDKSMNQVATLIDTMNKNLIYGIGV